MSRAELNFSDLFSTGANTSAEKPLTASQADIVELYHTDKENPTESKIEPLQSEPARRLLIDTQAAEQERQRARAILKAYQENTLKSGQLQTEITKGLQMGEPLDALFLKAVKAIALMTDNQLFYSQTENALQTKAQHSDNRLDAIYTALHNYHATFTPPPTTTDGWKSVGAMGESICERFKNEPFVVRMVTNITMQIEADSKAHGALQ